MHQSKNSQTTDSSSSEAVFDQLLDEIGERINCNEAVDLDSYTRKYPILADRLRKAVMGLRLVAGVAPALANDFDRELATRQSLGDFRLIRQLGAGGMGVVYEAEQLSLGRRVAIKILPFAAVLDQRQLVRFQNEARAAATLDHPHIVSVYGVGQERGVYYYAMQLIDGQSLAEVISQLRCKGNLRQGTTRLSDGDSKPLSLQDSSAPLVNSPCDTANAAISTFISEDENDFFRRVAQIGAQAAEALDHAHQQGIVHRDIKPANLLVDQLGRIHIADFGLARIDANPSLTMTGSVLGTIRYMSPEQALAKRDITDHHTDIFSLGATLYELLTLRPARDGEERHQILRQIEEEEPPRPRTLQPKAPVALETILLKAMATQVSDRYDTAAELALDLQNFLDGNPIVGRRPSRVRRVGHWVARHRLSATLLVAIFCLAGGLAIGGPIFAQRYSRIAHKEQIARHELERLLTETLTNATESLENSPMDPELHLPILDNTASQYETLLERVEDHDAQLLSDIAWGYYRLGRVIAFLVDQDRGESMVHRAQTIVTSLLAEQPTHPELQFRLATILAWQSIQAWSVDFNHALDLGWRGLRIMEQLVSQHPNSPQYEGQLAECQLFLGLLLRQTSHSKLLGSQIITDAYHAAVRLSDEFPQNSWYLVLRAVTLSHLADLKASEGEYEEALRLYRDYEQLRLRASPSVLTATRNRVGIGEAMLDMAKVLRKLGHEQEAESYLAKYAKDLGEVVSAYPNTDWARMTLSRLQWELADVLAAKGDLEGSFRTLRNAASNSNIRNPWFQAALYMDLGNLAAFLGEEEEARRCYQFVVESGKQPDMSCWIHANAADERFRDLKRASELVEAVSSNNSRLRARSLGIVDYRRGDFVAARQHLTDARRDETEPDPGTWFFAAMVEHQLGDRERAVEYYTRAKQATSARKGLDFYHVWPIDLEAATLLGLETQSPFSNNKPTP